MKSLKSFAFEVPTFLVQFGVTGDAERSSKYQACAFKGWSLGASFRLASLGGWFCEISGWGKYGFFFFFFWGGGGGLSGHLQGFQTGPSR